MTTARQLLELQDLDALLDGARQDLTQIKRRLEDRSMVEMAQVALAQAQGQRKDMVRRQKELELEVESLAAKEKALKEKMYSGSVTNSKELTAMLQESEQLATVVRGQEDHLLDSMLQVDQLSNLIQELQSKTKEAEAAWAEEHDRLLKDREVAEAELRSLEARRSAMVERIDPAPLALYQSLREDKQGIAVAKVEKGMCMGCRITLPARDIQQARSGRQLARCNSCGRILLAN